MPRKRQKPRDEIADETVRFFREYVNEIQTPEIIAVVQGMTDDEVRVYLAAHTADFAFWEMEQEIAQEERALKLL